MVGNMGSMKLQKDMIKKQIQNVDSVIDDQTHKEFKLVSGKNDLLMRDFNRMSYRRIMLQKQYSRVLVGLTRASRSSRIWRLARAVVAETRTRWCS